MKFSVGSRVNVKRGVGIGGKYTHQNGTILHIGKSSIYDDTLYSIEFDNDIGGHNCSGLGKERHCWRVMETDVYSLNQWKGKQRG